MMLDGVEVNELAPAERGIALVFQSYAFYPHMSVYENMAFGLKLEEVGASGAEERVKTAAGILQIEHLLDRKPEQLSGGQRQRVTIGRAIVRDPKGFCSTNRSRTWTPRYACRCVSRSPSCATPSTP